MCFLDLDKMKKHDGVEGGEKLTNLQQGMYKKTAAKKKYQQKFSSYTRKLNEHRTDSVEN
jgi:hypothetical protein